MLRGHAKLAVGVASVGSGPWREHGRAGSGSSGCHRRLSHVPVCLGGGSSPRARLLSELRPSPLSSHPTLLIWSNGS